MKMYIYNEDYRLIRAINVRKDNTGDTHIVLTYNQYRKYFKHYKLYDLLASHDNIRVYRVVYE